jgi:hypothetical protein
LTLVQGVARSGCNARFERCGKARLLLFVHSQTMRYDVSQPMADNARMRYPPLTQHVLDEGEWPVTLDETLLTRIATRHLLLRPTHDRQTRAPRPTPKNSDVPLALVP